MSAEVSTKASIARSAGLLGGFTMISRILGFVRDILIANIFGTTAAAEAFVVSFKLPNLFRDLLGEGAMNSAIVPVLTDIRTKEGENRFRQAASSLFLIFLLLLIVLSVLGVIAAPWAVRVLAPGFELNSEKYHLTVQLTRIIFPFVGLIGVAALFMGILNTKRIFGPSAVGPALLNISMIIALTTAVQSHGVYALAYFILIGGAAQILVQMPWIIREGIFRFSRLIDPAIRKIVKLLIPRIWGTAVYQTSVFVDTILASFSSIVGAGGQSGLYFASRLFQLPLSVFGVALAQAALPALSNHHALGDSDAFVKALNFAIKTVMYLVMPAAFGLAVFSDMIIVTLLQRGAFTAYSSSITSSALFFYALGLPACGLIKIFVSAFYSIHDTRTPVKTASISLLVNIGCNLLLMFPLKLGGLALATSIAASFNACLLFAALRKRIPGLSLAGVTPSIMAALSASAIMVAAAVLIKLGVRSLELDGGVVSVAALFISLGLCAAVYFVSAALLGRDDFKIVLEKFRTKK